MQTKAKFRFRQFTQTPPARHPGSDNERAPRLIALAGAVLMTALGVASMATTTWAIPTTQHASAPTAPKTIHGIPVFDLPSVDVNANVMRPQLGNDVASITQTDTFGGSLLRTLNGDVDPATLIGSQLAMPYYSFGSQFGRISKD